MAVRRAASRATLNTLARLSSSSGVSRSTSSVPRPARFRPAATNWLRGLCLLLPLPWTKITSPPASAGMTSDPGSRALPASTVTSAGSGAASRGPGYVIAWPSRPTASGVGDLREVLVPVADRDEGRRGVQADHLVGVAPQRRDRLGSRPPVPRRSPGWRPAPWPPGRRHGPSTRSRSRRPPPPRCGPPAVPAAGRRAAGPAGDPAGPVPAPPRRRPPAGSAWPGGPRDRR